MPYFTLIRDAVEILRAPVVRDIYNSDRRDWSAAVVAATGIAAIQPGFSSETTDDRQTVVTTWRFVSADVALYGLLATDRIRWQGRVFEVDSDAMLWRMHGADHHIEANLREVHG